MKNLVILTSILLFTGCATLQSYIPWGKDDSVAEEAVVEETIIQETADEEILPKSIMDDAQPFFPVRETLEGIQSELDDLRARVIEYESKISAPRVNTDLLKLIKVPDLTHEVTIENGTIVRGSIFHENADKIILNTQIGQLTIDKGSIISVEEIAKPEPNVGFDGDAVEEIYGDRRVYKGTVKNTGLHRADFTRIVYMLWGENTELISKDSSFVDGQITVYDSGIITDSGVNPGEYADFEVIVPLSGKNAVEYVTREIHWEVTE